ncbi:MAG TPA: multidrug effflux MFS transporter [Gammaproteobacteria bacterium]|nr:multidrug effflux MFS transporter [Gammaproteobacteria bacterium]
MCFAMAALTQAALVLYTPAFLQIAAQFQISSSQVRFTLAAYLLGFGLAQLPYGILSDHYGRKKLIIIGLVIFSLGCILSLLAHSYVELLSSRIIQGVGAGSCMTLSRAIMRDCFTGSDYVKGITYLSSGFAFGLGITPVIGGHLLDYFSWRSEFVFLLICGLLLLTSVWTFLPETVKLQSIKLPTKVFFQQTVRPLISVLKSKGFACYLVGGVAAYGVIITYNTMAPFLLQKTLAISSAQFGWLTLIVAATYYLATSFNRYFLKFVSVENLLRIGLALIFLAGISLLLSKIYFNVINVYVILIPMLFATFGQALIWSISIAFALKDLSHIAGTASALFSSLQMLLSALLSAIIAVPAEQDQIPMAVVVIFLAIISWVSFRFVKLPKSKR